MKGEYKVKKRLLAIILASVVLASVLSLGFNAGAVIDTSIKYGDIDSDKDVDTDDCIKALRAAAGLESIKDEGEKQRADINSDGYITIYDARQILRHIAFNTSIQPTGKIFGFDSEKNYYASEDALIYAFNTSLNRIKTDMPGFDKHVGVAVTRFDIEKVGSLGNAAQGIVDKIENELINAEEKDETKTFVKGDNCDNAVSAETKPFVSRLTADEILGAESSYDIETNQITIRVALANCEINNAGQSAFNDVFNTQILYENSESVVKKIFDTDAKSDGKSQEIQNCVLTAVIDKSTGDVVSYETDYETYIKIDESNFAITKLYGVEYGTRVITTYNNFQW